MGMQMNSQFSLLNIINRQPNAQFARKIMRKRMHDALNFANMLKRQRRENWPVKRKVTKTYEMDDYL